MKAIVFVAAVLCCIVPASADHRVDVDIDIDINNETPFFKPLNDVNVNIVGIIGKDFVDAPTVEQVFSSLRDSVVLGGVGWEVVIRRFGLGGAYLVLFEPDENDSWWLNWETQPLFASCHLLGGGATIDPFIDAGFGCAGRVYLGPRYISGDRLGISIYPFAGAGLAFNFDSFRIGAKISAMPWQGRLPATAIPGYEVGAFQVQLFAGVSLGAHH
jgi:hypothetical protein